MIATIKGNKLVLSNRGCNDIKSRKSIRFIKEENKWHLQEYKDY